MLPKGQDSQDSKQPKQKIWPRFFVSVLSVFCKNLLFECFREWWYPQVIHFNWVFHDKPSILGVPLFLENPFGRLTSDILDLSFRVPYMVPLQGVGVTIHHPLGCKDGTLTGRCWIGHGSVNHPFPAGSESFTQKSRSHFWGGACWPPRKTAVQ